MILRFLLCFLLIFVSCGKKEGDELRDDAITEADFFLTDGRCQEAIDVLEAAGRNSRNGRFTKKLATAYACRAGFNTALFFDNDIELIATAHSELGGLTRFKVSQMMDAPDNESYEDMKEAIDLLLYAGGLSHSQNPSSEARREALGAEAGQDVDALLMYLVMNHFGQYLYYYGNTSSSGQKGVRVAADNKCLVAYDNLTFDNPIVPGVSDLYDYLDVESSDTCSSTNATDGHPDLGAIGSLNIARMCEGVTLLNNFLEIFPKVIAEFGGADFDDLDGVDTVLNAAKDILVAAEPSTINVTRVKSQALCESQNESTDENLQFYMATLIEGIFL